jgi:hypothetical protein
MTSYRPPLNSLIKARNACFKAPKFRSIVRTATVSTSIDPTANIRGFRDHTWIIVSSRRKSTLIYRNQTRLMIGQCPS